MCHKIVSSSLGNHRLMISFLRSGIQNLPRNFKNTMKKFFLVDIAYCFCSTFSQVHITRASSIPDHCSTYALTDTKEECLQEMCDHALDKSCPFRDRLKDTLKEIELNLSEANLDEEDQDDVMYSFQQAYTAIEAWKAHQLRSIQQDKARLNIIDTLAESSVLITQDWAMKFLPRKYRETQADWFAKRGISWHISTVVRRKGNLQHQAFVHIVKNCNQDSDAVVSVLRHTLQQLKMDHPETTTAFLRQDNAGCYHSVTMLAACGLMEKATSSNTGFFITQPIRIEYFKHMTELIHSRPISVQDFMGVSTTCKTITKSLPTFPRHVRHTKSHVSTNFILTSYLALQSGRV